MMFRNSLLALAIVIVLLAFAAPAYACPMCKDAVEGNPQLAAGYNWSIIALVSLPFILVAVGVAQMARASQPAVYQELKRRAWDLVWPRGWLYFSAGVLTLTLSYYVTTPPDPATRFGLPHLELAAQPTINPDLAFPPLEDRVVVVTFFASWCPPCVEQMADLAQLRAEFEADDVVFVAVNAFEDYAPAPGVAHLHADGTLEFHSGAPNLPQFLETNHFAIPVVVETPALLAAFGGVTRIPTTLVFDAQGRLVKRYVNAVRGDFVRPELDDLRGTLRGALRCGLVSVRLIRDGCAFFVH